MTPDPIIQRISEFIMFHYDPTISLGNILTIVGLLIMFFRFYTTLVSDLSDIKNKVNLMWKKFENDIVEH